MKKLIRNRTLVAVICMVIAVLLTFVISPLLSKASMGTTTVLRLKADIKQGSEITAGDIEEVQLPVEQIHGGMLRKSADAVGKFAASYLYAGDFLTNGKLSDQSSSAEDVFARLDGSKVAVSVQIDKFAAGLSGKLANGDIISIIVVDPLEGALAPETLKYVQVVTTTTSGGIDQDDIVKNDDGSYEIPSTVTVLVNYTQAKLLAQYEQGSALRVALVCRGFADQAAEYLAKQDAWFQNSEKEVTGIG